MVDQRATLVDHVAVQRSAVEAETMPPGVPSTTQPRATPGRPAARTAQAALVLAFSAALAGCFPTGLSSKDGLVCAETKTSVCAKPDADVEVDADADVETDADADAELDVDADADLDGTAPASQGTWTAVVTEVACTNADGELSKIEILVSPVGSPSSAGAGPTDWQAPTDALRLRCCSAAGSGCEESPLTSDPTGTNGRHVFRLSAPFAPPSSKSDASAGPPSCALILHGLVADSFALWDSSETDSSEPPCSAGQSWQLAPGWESPEANDVHDNWCLGWARLGLPNDCGGVVLLSLEPSWGHAAGGEELTIRGTGFGPTSFVDVEFREPNGTLFSSASGVSLTPRTLRVVAPAHLADDDTRCAGGLVRVSLRESSASTLTFRYAGQDVRGVDHVWCRTALSDDSNATEIRRRSGRRDAVEVVCYAHFRPNGHSDAKSSSNLRVQVGYGPADTFANRASGWAWYDLDSCAYGANTGDGLPVDSDENLVCHFDLPPDIAPGAYFVSCRVAPTEGTPSPGYEFVYCNTSGTVMRFGEGEEPSLPFDPSQVLSLTVLEE